MNTEIKTKPDIPDTSRAEEWLSEDIFVFNGEQFKVLPDFQVVKISDNGDSKIETGEKRE